MSSGTESGSDNADERVTVGVGLIESVGGGGDGPATEAATAGAAAAGTHDYTPVNFKWIGRGPAVEGASAVDPHMANGRPRMLPPWRCKICKTKNFQSRLVTTFRFFLSLFLSFFAVCYRIYRILCHFFKYIV